MSKTSTEIPKGSYAAGERVRIPAGAEAPFTVFINGVEQQQGADYDVEGNEVVFTRPIIKEQMNTGRWLAMYLGLFGTYRKNETIDLQFRREGRTELLKGFVSARTRRKFSAYLVRGADGKVGFEFEAKTPKAGAKAPAKATAKTPAKAGAKKTAGDDAPAAKPAPRKRSTKSA